QRQQIGQILVAGGRRPWYSRPGWRRVQRRFGPVSGSFRRLWRGERRRQGSVRPRQRFGRGLRRRQGALERPRYRRRRLGGLRLWRGGRAHFLGGEPARWRGFLRLGSRRWGWRL